MSKHQNTRVLRASCNRSVSRKIRKLRREGVSQNVAVARGISQTRTNRPRCREVLRQRRRPRVRR